MKSRFSRCSNCDAVISKGADIFYYPNDKTVMCHDCGQEASWEFQSNKQDEEFYNQAIGGY